jgi:hypothetical protein
MQADKKVTNFIEILENVLGRDDLLGQQGVPELLIHTSYNSSEILPSGVLLRQSALAMPLTVMITSLPFPFRDHCRDRYEPAR